MLNPVVLGFVFVLEEDEYLREVLFDIMVYNFN